MAKSTAEELLKAQKEPAEENPRNKLDKKEPKKEVKEIKEVVPVGSVVLTGSASVFTHGLTFKKGVPKKVDDPELLKYLMESGLFKKGE